MRNMHLPSLYYYNKDYLLTYLVTYKFWKMENKHSQIIKRNERL